MESSGVIIIVISNDFDLSVILRPCLQVAFLLGIVTGFENPWVFPQVYLGYGSGYGFLYPRKTRTCGMGLHNSHC
jgi:hypothetical protein